MDALYVFVEDGQVHGGQQALPAMWRDGSVDLRALSDEELADLGWLRAVVIDQRMPGQVELEERVEIDGRTVRVTLSSRAETVDERTARVVAVAEGMRAQLTDYYDAVAARRGYTHRDKCALRAAWPGPYQAEGVAFGAWMDQCNQASYAVRAAVLSGQRMLPTFDELLAELPAAPW